MIGHLRRKDQVEFQVRSGYEPARRACSPGNGQARDLTSTLKL